MGFNRFVEGPAHSLVIKIRLHREEHTFRDIKQIAAAFEFVDSAQSQFWPKMWPDYRRKSRHSELLYFSKRSPLEISLLADPAWLAILVIILIGYHDAKISVNEAVEDLRQLSNEAYEQIERLVGAIKGLTDHQRQLLGIAVRLSLEALLRSGEQKLTKTLVRFRRARQAIVGQYEQLPDLEVVEIGKEI